jgi:hypothetical protein
MARVIRQSVCATCPSGTVIPAASEAPIESDIV